MGSEHDPDSSDMMTDSAQHEAFTASRLDRDRTLEAVRRLEEALAMAAGGTSWLSEVTGDLERLTLMMAEERKELNRPDSLLAMIAADYPRRFGARVRNLREQYDDIIRQLGSLGDQMGNTEDSPPEPTDLRQRAGWIINALHHCRARQTDLVFEALSLDLGERALR